MLGLPLIDIMRERHPQVRLCLVEALSGHLSAMLNARELDMAILFNVETGRRWNVLPLLDEQLFLIAPPTLPGLPASVKNAPGATTRLAQLARVPLVLPSSSHGLRATLTTVFAHARVTPHVVAEIDSLNLLMDTVLAGHGATIQPGAAMARIGQLPGVELLRRAAIADARVNRRNFVVSLSDEELSPAALITRVTLIELARKLVRAGHWAGASLLEN
jgi:LysR family tcuABC transcriptional regulator